MAVNDKKNEQDKETLMTAEQYAKLEREKRKEKINAITRVAGVIGLLLLAVNGLIGVVFRLSIFGWLWDQITGGTVFYESWSHEIITEAGNYHQGILSLYGIYTDPLDLGNWVGIVSMTCVFICVVLLVVYFVTYSTNDFIDLVREFIKNRREIKNSLKKEDTNNTEKKKPEKKTKRLFEKNEIPQPRVKKRKEEDSLSSADEKTIDLLLNGVNPEDINRETGTLRDGLSDIANIPNQK